MDQILTPVDAPDSLFVYRDGQKFACSDYDRLHELLAESLFENGRNERLVLDLTQAPTHLLAFEIALREEDSEKSTHDFLNRFVDFVFVRALHDHLDLPEITLLQAATRERNRGLRVYVAGVEISHDDYLHLCGAIRDRCRYEEGEDLSAFLVVPSDFPLPSCDRPGGPGDLYYPVRLVRVQFEAHQKDGVWYPYRQEIVALDPEGSGGDLFDQIANQHPSRWKETVRDMSPVPRENATRVHYPARIGKTGDRRRGEWPAVEIKSLLDGEVYTVFKRGGFLVKKGEGDENEASFFFSLRDFLRENADQVEMVHSHDHDLPWLWHARFRSAGRHGGSLKYGEPPLEEGEEPLFRELERELRRRCPHLREEPDPLATVLSSHERPVYNALLNLLRERGRDDDDGAAAERIRERFPFLAEDLLASELPAEARRLTADTVLHCAYLTGNGGGGGNNFSDRLGAGLGWIAGNVASLPKLKRLALRVQKRMFPVAIDAADGRAVVWDPVAETWKKGSSPDEEEEDLREVIRKSVELLRTWAESASATAGTAGLSSELIERLTENELELNDAAHLVREEARRERGGAVEGNAVPESFDAFGRNVPEYYFFDAPEE